MKYRIKYEGSALALGFLFEALRGAVYQHHALAFGPLFDLQRGVDYDEQEPPSMAVVITKIFNGAHDSAAALEHLNRAFFGGDEPATPAFSTPSIDHDNCVLSWQTGSGRTLVELCARQLIIEREGLPDSSFLPGWRVYKLWQDPSIEALSWSLTGKIDRHPFSPFFKNVWQQLNAYEAQGNLRLVQTR